MDKINRDTLEQLKQEVIACTRCPRLVEWRQKVAAEKRRAFRDFEYWGKPLPGFGDLKARLAIIGLAPAAHGGNRTGRMFTGDGSADSLIAAMHRAGFANQSTSTHRGDGLELIDAYMTAVVRCAPPANRPTPQELNNCRSYLACELMILPSVKVVLVLGLVAFSSYRRLLQKQGYRLPTLSFAHGMYHKFKLPLPVLMASYHPSRQNTQTGRLTAAMLDGVFARVRQILEEKPE